MINKHYERQFEADCWLRKTLGHHEAKKIIDLMTEYLKMGGRRPVLDAGMRVVVYDRKADRERQRLARIRKKVG